MKFRQPLTEFDAVDRCGGLLGWNALSTELGRGVTVVRKYGDPDEEAHRIRLFEAIRADKACKAATGETPILNYYLHEVEAVEFTGAHVAIVDALLESHCAIGRLTESVKAAKAPTGPGGTRMLDSEKAAVMKHLRTLRRHLDDIERACTERAPDRLHVVPGSAAE